MKKCFSLLILVVIAISCGKENKVSIIKNNNYSIEIPNDLTETKLLNDVASLQYENQFKEFYVIVIDESKKSLLDFFAPNSETPNNLYGYSELLKVNMASVLGKVDFSKIETIQINGMKAKVFSVETKIENLDAYYKFGFFESKNSYYQVMLWTLLDKKVDHEPRMQKIIESFKETNTNREAKVVN